MNLPEIPIPQPDPEAEAKEERERREQMARAAAEREHQLAEAVYADVMRLRQQATVERAEKAAKPPRARFSVWVWPFRRTGGYSSTTAAGALYHAVSEPGLGVEGVLLGKETWSGTGSIYDPFVQYGDMLPSPNMLVLGEMGTGKSAASKCYVLRQLTFGRFAAVLDSKNQQGEGEWVTMARSLGFTPITPGAGVVINPLDPRIAPESKGGKRGGRVGQDAILRTILEVAIERKMDKSESRALRTAHRRVLSITSGKIARPTDCPFGKGDTPILPHIEWALLHPSRLDADAARLTLPRAMEVGRILADGINELCSGDLAGLVDSETTEGLDLDQQLLVFDLSQIDSDSAALPVLMAVIGVFLQAAWIRPDGRKRILVIEEGWHVIGHLPTAKLVRRLMKFARALGLQVLTILHRLSDLDTGDAELSATIRTILAESATRMIFRQHFTEKERVAKAFGLPVAMGDELDGYGRGHCLFQVGRRRYKLHIVRTDYEGALTNTDAAMEDEDDLAAAA